MVSGLESILSNFTYNETSTSSSSGAIAGIFP